MIPIPNLDILINLLTTALPFILILLFLLPTVIEIKKPKDAGPRRILEEETIGINYREFLSGSLTPLTNLEDEYSAKQRLTAIDLIDIFQLIPNIET